MIKKMTSNAEQPSTPHRRATDASMENAIKSIHVLVAVAAFTLAFLGQTIYVAYRAGEITQTVTRLDKSIELLLKEKYTREDFQRDTGRLDAMNAEQDRKLIDHEARIRAMEYRSSVVK